MSLSGYPNEMLHELCNFLTQSASIPMLTSTIICSDCSFIPKDISPKYRSNVQSIEWPQP